jgi:GntR family transcriptional regulator, transcriptional repressor for pyruvate dehydrogenase complex
LIARGELKPGDALDPVEVAAERFGVSPAVIREARQRLMHAGLITIRHGSGAVVTPSSQWLATEHLGRLARSGRPGHRAELRAYLAQELRFERDGARVGAQDPQSPAFAALIQARNAFEVIARSTSAGPSSRDYDFADLRFHRAIVELSGDPAAASLSEIARGVLLEAGLRQRRSADDIRADRLEHDAIIEAIGSGDEERAQAVTVAHLGMVADRRSARGSWR